jgi:tetratricopeptide (TPR) repeat protein
VTAAPSRLALALAALLPITPVPAFSFNFLAPFSREDPRVKAGNAAYSAGHYDEALKGYEEALRDHPNAPELQFDRGNALFKLGRQAEAREAYLSALAAKDSSLKAQDYYNMGNALWELDKNGEAAEAYQRALMLDPNLEDARHNLELLLAPPPDAGQPDGGGQDGGSDGGGADGGQSKSQSGDGGQGNQSEDAGQNKPNGEDGGPPKDQNQGDAGQNQPQPPPPPQQGAKDGGGPKPQPQPLDKLQADQLLDALRQREKNLQMWKFRQKQAHSKEAEKDW